jgi:hypothetical protein
MRIGRRISIICAQPTLAGLSCATLVFLTGAGEDLVEVVGVGGHKQQTVLIVIKQLYQIFFCQQLDFLL